MSDDHDPSGICEHGEIRAACIECIGKPYARPRKAPPTPRPTRTPRSSEEQIAALSGNKDISVPVFKLGPYLDERTDWLLAQGYPHELRPGGWLYLRCDEGLRARVRVRGMRWSERRPWRTGQEAVELGGDEPDNDGAGPGLVFDLAPDTWEPISIELGPLAERQRSGFRYLLTTTSGEVVHLMADDPIPDGDWDPAYAAPEIVSIRLPKPDHDAAIRSLSRLRDSVLKGDSIADELEKALLAGQIAADLLARHSKWCNTGGSWAAAVDPACATAVAMYGFVPERLLDGEDRPVENYADKLAVITRRIEDD